MPDNPLVLVDGGATPVDPTGTVARWSGIAERDDEYSIPAEVETSCLDIKAEYLSWVDKLGRTSVSGRSLCDALLFEDLGLSAWWLNLVPDAAPLKTENIYKVFKLRALERLYARLNPDGLIYEGRDRRLHETLEAWCATRDQPYRWRRRGAAVRRAGRGPLIRLGRSLPYWVQALAFFLWKLTTRYLPAFFRGPRPAPPDTACQALVVTYFPNIDFDRARDNVFWSHYWQDLPDVLDSLGITPNWVWMHDDTPTCDFSRALTLRQRFNTSGPRGERHYLLEDFVTFGVLRRALWAYAQLWVRGLALRGIRDHFVLPGSNVNFYPLLKHEWRSSVFGTSALSGMLYHSLFDSVLRTLPAQRWCLYVWESQPWEAALISVWRRRQARPIIGYQHATIMPLNLEAFFAPAAYHGSGTASLPMPDVLAINGRGARDLLREVGYPDDKVAVVEALRYPQVTRRASASSSRGRTLLAIGGYLKSETEFLLRILNDAADLIRYAGFTRVLVRGHPFGPSSMIHGPLPLRIPHETVATPLDRLLSDTDFALVSNSTSAVLEAIYAGVPVAVCGSVENLNLSPVFGHPGIPFVMNGMQLAAALSSPRCALLPWDYFLVSDRLDRWTTLLSTPGHDAPAAGGKPAP